MIYKNLILGKLEEVAFLELKDETKIKIGDEDFYGYLPLPILNENLITLVKEEIEDIPLEYFLEGMIYSISLQPDGEYNDIYLDILNSATKDTKGYVFSRGVEKLNLEKYLESMVYFNFLVEENLVDEKVYFSLGQSMENIDISLLDEQEKNAYAIEIMNVYEKVLNINKEFPLGLYKLGYLYKEFGQFIKSKLTFEKFIQVDKNDFRIQEVREVLEEINSEILKEEAVLELNSGNFDKALKKLLEVNVEKRDDLYFYHLSLCYVNLGDFEGALDAIKKSIDIKDLAVYHNQLAIVYQGLGNMNLAKKEIEETIDKFGPDYYLNFNLGTIQYNEGDIKSAIGNFEIAYELDSNPELGDIIEQLKENTELE